MFYSSKFSQIALLSFTNELTALFPPNPAMRFREAIAEKSHKTADFFRIGGGAQPYSIAFVGVFPQEYNPPVVLPA